MNEISINILSDNLDSPSTPSLKCEHGLSMLIKAKEATILCDTGASEIFSHNAARLGLDLDNIDFAFLSHGHSDHTGGLGALLEKWSPLKNFRDKKIYASRAIFNEYYFSGRRGYWRAMSTDHSLLKEYPDNFILIEEPSEVDQPQGRWITPSIAIVSNGCHKWSRPYGNIYLTRQPAANGLSHLTADPTTLLPDNFQHELSLAILTTKGLVIISSCSHCGALNIMESCMDFTGEQRVAAFIGGLHFIDSPEIENEVETFARQLHIFFDNGVQDSAQLPVSATVPRIITGHCTCNKAKELLAKKIPGIEFFYTGAEITI